MYVLFTWLHLITLLVVTLEREELLGEKEEGVRDPHLNKNTMIPSRATLLNNAC
jgi:hypothetical protein